MVLDLLKDIEKIKNRDGKSIMIPASDKNIQVIKMWVSKNIKNGLSISEYEDFLKRANGLEFNGLVIYNAQLDDDNNGFIGANEIWRANDDWDSNYLFFGDSSISWYCLDVNNFTYLELDKPSAEIVDEYENFGKMIEEALRSVL